MFTGLIEEIGVIEKIDRYPKILNLSVKRPFSFNDIKAGDSIAINGACLTITYLDKKVMVFDVMRESLERTNLGVLKKGDKVNLEQAIRMGSRLGGHFVTGHIDYKAQINNLKIKESSTGLEITLPKEYRKYIVIKGSVAVDGVSLTVGEVLKDTFSVYLIPHTLKNTTLGLKKKKDFVNIEVDLLAKLVLDSKDEISTSKINMGFLKEHGFV